MNDQFKKCERCKDPAAHGERFCGNCRKDVFAELIKAGYFQWLPPTRAYRSEEKKEKTRDTKYGEPSPGFEDMVRKLEDGMGEPETNWHIE